MRKVSRLVAFVLLIPSARRKTQWNLYLTRRNEICTPLNRPDFSPNLSGKRGKAFRFTNAWEQRKLSDGMTEYTDKVFIEDDQIYKQVTVKNTGEISLRGSQPGRNIGRKRQARVNLRDYPMTLIFTRQTVEQGGIGFAKNDVDGCIVTENMPTIAVDGKKFNQDFLVAFFKTYGFRKDVILSNIEGGTAQIAIHEDDILDSSSTFPSLKEQIKIGNFFRTLSQQITLHQRKYEKLLNIKKSMLEKMFPKEGEVVPEIRFKGFTGAWEQRKFGEMANRRSEVSASGNLPRVEYEDIVSGTGTLNKDVFEKQSQKQGIVFHSGDVLYGKLRPYLQNWLLASFNGLAVGDFWVLEPQGLNSNYLYRIIQTKQFDEIANQSVGTKMPRADWKLVSKATFLNPASFNEQRLIGKFFKDIDSLLTLHQR